MPLSGYGVHFPYHVFPPPLLSPHFFLPLSSFLPPMCTYYDLPHPTLGPTAGCPSEGHLTLNLSAVIIYNP